MRFVNRSTKKREYEEREEKMVAGLGRIKERKQRESEKIKKKKKMVAGLWFMSTVMVKLILFGCGSWFT